MHAKLKIHPRVLQLLEEDKFEKLPSAVFAKSFLKSYADFLEVNSEELVSTYEKEKRKEPEQILYIKPADPSAGRPRVNAFYIIAGVCGAALVVFALTGEPSKILKALPHKIKFSAPGPESGRKGKSVPAKSFLLEEEKTASALKEGSAPAEWLNRASQGNFPKLNRKAPLTLEIKALDAVWVHVTADGAVVFQGVLKKGSSDQWTAKNALEIWTGNASNMALTLNKNPLGSPGKGVVKKMVISHEGIRILTPIGA